MNRSPCTLSRLLPALVLAGMLSTAALAQDDSTAAQPEPDLDALRDELEQARTELAETARRVAEISRKLAGTETRSAFGWVFRNDGDDAGEAIEFDRVQRLKGDLFDQLRLRPRIGVLLGGEDSSDRRTIVGVTPGSGAAEAGIRTGDVLLAINGFEIPANDADRVREALRGVEPGESVRVRVERDGQPLELDVETGSVGRDIRMIVRNLERMPGMDGDFRVHMPDVRIAPLAPLLPRFSVLGPEADLIDNHAGLAPYFGTGDGVLVLRIGADNPLGLKDGDVILTFDREPVDDPVALGSKLLAHEAGAEVRLEVMRDGVLTELQGTVPERGGREIHEMRFRIETPDDPEPPEAPTSPPARTML